MKTLGMMNVLLLVALAIPVAVFGEVEIGESESRSQSLSDIRKSVAELSSRVESLELQLGNSSNVSNQGNPPRDQSGPACSTPRAWDDLVAGAVMALSAETFGDNALTVAIYDESQHLNLLRNSHGKWIKVASQLLPTSETPRLLVADLDRDGNAEILVCSDKLRVYTVDGKSFSLSWSSHESFPEEEVPVPQMGIADFNGDGRNDIAVLNYKDKGDSDTQSLYVYTRTLSRPLDFGLTDVATFTDEHGYHSTAGMAIADYSGDGSPDIAVSNSNGFLWFVTFDAGKLNVRKQWNVPSGGAIGAGLSSGNFDADSASELLVGTNGGNIFVVDLDDEFEPRVLAGAMAGRLAYGVAAGDINGDGRDEFVLTRGHIGYAGMTQKDVVAEAWQLGNEGLTRVWQQETVDQPRPLVRDIDADGRPEVVVLSLHGKNLAVLEPRQ